MEKEMGNVFIFSFAASMKKIIKRIFDIVVSAVVLILLAPFFGLIALAIKRDTPGPVFYSGTRVGKNGKLFKMYKFRTMYENEKSYRGAPITAHDDDRITPLGHWLRDTKLNELPQFINVLKGDMSLVGPRPEDPTLTKTWPLKIRDEILSVRPGVTSPATVVYHNEEALLSSHNVLQQYVQEIGPDKNRLDQMYVSRHNFILDLDILLWTSLSILPLVKKSTPPESLLFVGPITRFFKRYMSCTILDFLFTFASITIIAILWRSSRPLDVGWLKSIAMAFVFSMLFSATGLLMGIYKINWAKAQTENFANLFFAWLLASVAAVGINRSFDVFPTLLVVEASSLALAGFITSRYYKRIATKFFSVLLRAQETKNSDRKRVLIVGSGRTAEHVAWMVYHPSNASKYHVIGFIDDDFFTQGMRIYGSKVLGTLNDIPAIVHKYDIDLIFLADHRISREQFGKIIQTSQYNKLTIMLVPDIFGSLMAYDNGNSRSIEPLWHDMYGANDFGEQGVINIGGVQWVVGQDEYHPEHNELSHIE